MSTPATPEGPWFNEIARFLGDAYWAPDSTRVQAFTVGTNQEVDFLVENLGLEPGMRVLDAGCGPGRHSLELAASGLRRRRPRPFAGVHRAKPKPARGDLDVEFVVGDVRRTRRTSPSSTP